MALRTVAARFQALAEDLDVHGARPRLEFGPTGAGRAHVAAGQSLRECLDQTGAALSNWARAVAEIAAVLSAGAGRYRAADAGFAAGIGSVG